MSTLDGNAVTNIERITKEAARAVVLSVPGEAPGHAWIQNPGENAERVELVAQPRKYSAFSLDGLRGQIDHFASEGDGSASVLALVGRGRVTVMLDEAETRLHRLTMDLPVSKPFAFLTSLANSVQKYDQKQVVWALRTQIGADNIMPTDLLARLKSLKFTQSSDGNSDIKVGRESMGKQVVAAVVGGGKDLPESCVLSVPVYADLVLSGEVQMQPIECAIDIDIAEATFIVKPMPGELERAQRETDEAIRRYIAATVEASNVKVFNGGV